MKIKEKFISAPEHRILFTSDLHYGHANVIKHGNRPFANLEEMNSWILKELTTKIKPNDFLFDLGDMFWSLSSQQMCDILDQIPTKNIYKVVGNHDRYGIYYGSGGIEVKKRFKLISDILDIQVESERTGKTYMVTMSHYPMVTWNHKHYGSIMLHGHCVDEETEILTVEGFKKYNEISIGDLIYSYNKNSDLIEITTINEVIIKEHYNGYYYLLEERQISMCVTDEHTIVGMSTYPKIPKYIELVANECFSRNHQELKLIRSGKLSNKFSSFPLTDDELRLYISIAADGSIENKSTRYCKFNLKKERKINYLINLLKKLNIKYNIGKKSKKGAIKISFYCPENIFNYNIKGLDDKLLNCSIDQVKIILETYSVTDGRKTDNTYNIYTSKKCESDILQHLFTINGFICSTLTRVRIINNKERITYILKVRETTLKAINSSKAKKLLADDKLFWCIKTSNQNFFCRRRGFVYLTGNCHGNIDTYNDSTPDLRVDLGMDARLAKSLGGSPVIGFEDIISFFDQKTGGLDYMKWTNLKCKEL